MGVGQVSEEYIGPFLIRMLTDEQQRLYKTNAWFRLGVDHITLALPTILAGLAAVAEEKNAEAEKAVAVLMKGTT